MFSPGSMTERRDLTVHFGILLGTDVSSLGVSSWIEEGGRLQGKVDSKGSRAPNHHLRR